METKNEFDLLALGELLLRLSPPNNERIVRGETLQKQAGGAELNVVSGVSLLGLRTGIISKLPANDIGTYIKNRVRFCGVSDDYLVYDSEKDARLGVYYYENGAYPRKPGIVYDRMYTSMTCLLYTSFKREEIKYHLHRRGNPDDIGSRSVRSSAHTFGRDIFL